MVGTPQMFVKDRLLILISNIRHLNPRGAPRPTLDCTRQTNLSTTFLRESSGEPVLRPSSEHILIVRAPGAQGLPHDISRLILI